MTSVRRLIAALLVACSALWLAPTSAHAAEDGYRYWSFWQYANGQWDYAQKGPDGITPADGETLGWRYAVAGMKDKRTPRAAADFAAICKDAPAEPNKKRVAVVLDQGTAADAPTPADKPTGQVQGTCVVIKTEATAADTLAMVADVRKEKNKTCGIGGYPATTCTDPVKVEAPLTDDTLPLTVTAPKGSTAAPAAQAPAASSSSSATGWIVGGVIVVALAAGAIVLTRRRSA